MKWKRLAICSAAGYAVWKVAESQLLDEEWFMCFEQRCRKYGLVAEKHFVTTEDGYILQMFRVTDTQNTHDIQGSLAIL